MPDLYKKKIEGRPDIRIIEIDALKSLEEDIGKYAIRNRANLYLIVSGSCEIDTYRKLLENFFIKYSGFRRYYNVCEFLRDEDTSLIQGLVRPMREKIDNTISEQVRLVESMGGKVLMVTHDFVYASFKDEIPKTQYLKYYREVN